jgi:hypothetical protein
MSDEKNLFGLVLLILTLLIAQHSSLSTALLPS